jgi:hypothetical protein
MTHRPKEHVTGDRAISAVREAFEEHGFAVNENRKDYGEDLLVQTHHEGRMDASRLWVQVKGTEDVNSYRTSKKSKKDRFSLSFPLGTVMRWIRTIDLVIVVLWDVKRKAGWYAVPRRQINEWDVVRSGQKTVTLKFRKSPQGGPSIYGEFDTKAAYRLGWESRFEHFNLLVLKTLEVARERHGGSPTDLEERQKLSLIMRDFLRLLGFIDPEHADPTSIMLKNEVRVRAVEICKALLAGELGERPEGPEDAVMLTAVNMVAERLSEIDLAPAMPQLLFLQTCQALATLLALGRFNQELSGLG